MARRKAAVSSPSSGQAGHDMPEATSTSAIATSRILRKRPIPLPSDDAPKDTMDSDLPTGRDHDSEERSDLTVPVSWVSRNQWIVFAIASGGCAAFNGVFAKLTTNDLTSNISQALAKTFGLTAAEHVIELVFRCTFFGLNLIFNGVMWTLFTKALARGNSTTQVSIMNTSTNFMITALLGLMIFSESLPPLWWLGAAMLVAGNVIIGRKDESAADAEDSSLVPETGGYAVVAQAEAPGLLGVEKDDEDEDIPLIGEIIDDDDIIRTGR